MIPKRGYTSDRCRRVPGRYFRYHLGQYSTFCEVLRCFARVRLKSVQRNMKLVHQTQTSLREMLLIIESRTFLLHPATSYSFTGINEVTTLITSVRSDWKVVFQPNLISCCRLRHSNRSRNLVRIPASLNRAHRRAPARCTHDEVEPCISFHCRRRETFTVLLLYLGVSPRIPPSWQTYLEWT